MKENRVIGVVDCNNFYVSCERIFQPKYKNFPVIVLSNNDGCVVARSNEAKKLDIPMGVPYFKIRNIVEKYGIKVFSSNYSLYGDISRRIMSFLHDRFCEVDVYSIDEAFIDMTTMRNIDYVNYCKKIRKEIYNQIGVPVSVGISKTKTLAKLATHRAKKEKKYGGVCYIKDIEANSDYFKTLDTSEVWGIGSRLKKRLRELKIENVYDFINAEELLIKKKFGITLLRTQYELKGYSCVELDNYEGPKSIRRAGSFPEGVRDIDELKRTMGYFISRAAHNMRRKNVKAKFMTLFLARKNWGNEKEFIKFNSSYCKFITPINDTFNLTRAGERLLKYLYKKGELYKKMGVIFSDLKNESTMQYTIFDIFEMDNKIKEINNVMDSVNDKYGFGTLRIGTCGEKRVFRPKADKRSRRYTTDWDELLEAKTK